MVRNRVKRLLREAFRALRPRLLRTIDVVLIAKPECHELTFATAQAELAGVLPRLNAAPRPPPPPRQSLDHDPKRGPRSPSR